MVYMSRWKIISILIICLLAFVYALPNISGPATKEWLRGHMPAWGPVKTVNLGLDLQGGAHMLFAVDVNSVIKEQGDNLVSSIRAELREKKIPYQKIERIQNGAHIILRDISQGEQARRALRGIDNRIAVRNITKTSDTTSSDGVSIDAIEVKFTENALKEIADQTIAQSIEVVRRRIDETGTREPIIQRQGEDRILVQLPGLKDPSRIKALIGKTAKLTFHLVTGDDRTGRGGILLPNRDIPGQELRVERRPTLTGDMLTNAAPSFSQTGQPVVTFALNSIGARRFCQLTRDHTNEPFAIVLDGEIISAPNINEPICGGNAQISGRFTSQETADLSLLLRAGALPADLSVIEERSVGPSLGADSVAAGKNAAMVGLILVLLFMGISYGLFGWFANLALVANIAMIMALLSTLQATLTLPGIAGIVLTIGMAVDANVLIFERIREEVKAGRSIINAVEAGYSRAMTTIIDSNLTTLIAAFILYSFGTGPIKGFAVTLGIGIMTSFFSAIMITRLMVVTWLRRKRPSVLPL